MIVNMTRNRPDGLYRQGSVNNARLDNDAQFVFQNSQNGL